jgi:AmiR/NasT family two-component response regulator
VVCPGPRYRAPPRELRKPGVYLLPSDTENIIELLGPREVIGQAIDLLMTRDDVTRDAAFELLVQGSSGSHRKVREIAAEIIQQRKGE